MSTPHRPPALWIMVTLLILSSIVMLAGQTVSVFDYELASRLGLQEKVEQVSRFGVEVNRAFAATDTVVYIPLMLISAGGLATGRGWALITTAAVSGMSLYWSLTVGFMFSFLPGAPGYHYQPPVGIWTFVVWHAVFGLWLLGYLLLRRDRLT